MNKLAFYLILIFVVIPAVKALFKKLAQLQQAQKNSPKPTTFKPPPTSASHTSIPNANELANQRRRQLQELAALKRQSTPQPPATPQTIQPTNLTLTQAQQRAAAKAAYERRVQALKLQRQQQPTQPTSAPTPTPPPQPQQPRRKKQRQQTIAQSHPPQRPPQQAALSTQSSQPPINRLAPQKFEATPGDDINQRHLAELQTSIAAAHIPSPGQPAASNKSLLTPANIKPNSLRQAIVLSELLAPPLALR